MAHNVSPPPPPEQHQSLYERDYYTWTLEQARALKQRRAEMLDWENLAEEVEDLGKSERRELRNRLHVLLAHLLKWRHQPKRRSRSWRATATVQRIEIRQLLLENPGLKPTIDTLLAEAYQTARIEIAGLLPVREEKELPKSCPWSFDQVIAKRNEPRV